MRRFALPLSLGLVAALLTIAVLFAASIEQVTFTSGRPFDETIPHPHTYTIGHENPGPVGPLDQAIAYALGAAIVVSILLYLRRNAGRQGLPSRKGGRWIALLITALIVATTTGVLLYESGQPKKDASDSVLDSTSSQRSGAEGGAADVRTVDELLGTGAERTGAEGMPGVFAAVAILAAAAGAVATFSLAWLVRRRHRRTDDDVADQLLAPVRAAVAELRLGRDARGAVEQCYRQMVGALAERSRVDPECLTPREFVAALAKTGLDGPAIGELSTLFEEVHYGHRPEGSFAARALECMTAIAAAYPAPAPEVAS